MQIFVLGMHRSGTSALTRVLNLAGVDLGPTETLKGANPENPRGFWENDVFVDANKAVLRSIGCEWDCVAGFSLEAIAQTASHHRLVRDARNLLVRLDANRPWAMKDPRSCLTFGFWREVTELPIALFSNRDPFQIAASLYRRNSIPEAAGIALWELYMLSALRSTVGIPRMVVDFTGLIRDPAKVIEKVVDWLRSVGVRNLDMPDRHEFEVFLSSDLIHHTSDHSDERERLSPTQRALFDALRSGDLDSFHVDDHQLTTSSQHLLDLLQSSIRSERALLESRRENEELQGAKASLSEDAAKLDHLLARQKETVERLSASNDQLMTNLTSAENHREMFAALTRSVDQRINDSFARLVGLATEALEAQTKRAEEHRRRRLEVDSEAVRKLESELQSGRQSLVAVQAERDRLKTQLAERDLKYRQTMDAYQRRKAQHHEARARLRAVESSRSWRLAHGIARIAAFVRGTEAYKPAETRVAATGDDAAVVAVEHVSAKPVEVQPAPGSGSILNVVVCVHNALDDVKICLDSVLGQTPRLNHLIVIDDGSDRDTAEYLRSQAAQWPSIRLHRNETAKGYTRAANMGLQDSSAEFTILLNSDTIVTPGWSDALIRCAGSDSAIGIVGPLSNAASWQSIPSRFDGEGDWAINAVPPGLQTGQVAALLSQASERRYPRLPFVNGFCLLFTREVLDRVGYFDEENFPMGYGEENDYCLRAAQAGFKLAIADDSYVFHAKSKSFSHTRRKELAKKGRRALDEKHGPQAVLDKIEIMRNEQSLERTRMRMKVAMSELGTPLDPLSVLYVLPVKGGGGGVHSIVQESSGLNSVGCSARIAVPAKALRNFTACYPSLDGELFVGFRSHAELIEIAADYDLVVATIFTSVPIVAKILEAYPRMKAGYYIQDYEPWICGDDKRLASDAKASYTMIPGIQAFAKTDWICRTIEERHGLHVQKVVPSIDVSVYNPEGDAISPTRPGQIVVSAMIRPKTPRRGAPVTMDALAAAAREFGDRIDIHIFGCEEDDPGFAELERSFSYVNHGVLTREGVAAVLRGSDVFVDFSTYQAFGRTALEAMACGCAVAVPAKGGADEYARHEENALVVDTSDQDVIDSALARLIRDPDLRQRFKDEGLRTASRYSIARAVLSVHGVFRSALAAG